MYVPAIMKAKKLHGTLACFESDVEWAICETAQEDPPQVTGEESAQVAGEEEPSQVKKSHLRQVKKTQVTGEESAQVTGEESAQVTGEETAQVTGEELPQVTDEEKNLRKYMATITQVLDLKENQLQWVIKHLGHTMDVHKLHYR